MWCWRRADEIVWTDRVKNGVLHGVKEERNILRTLKRRGAICIGHILHRNCLLKHVIEGKIEEEIEMTGRRGSNQLLGTEKVMETERGSTRLPFTENWIWKRLWTCRRETWTCFKEAVDLL
jgi:hypothetical protein